MAYTKPRQEKKVKRSEEKEMRSCLLILDLKKTSCRILERKKKPRRFINCKFME